MTDMQAGAIDELFHALTAPGRWEVSTAVYTICAAHGISPDFMNWVPQGQSDTRWGLLAAELDGWSLGDMMQAELSA